VRAVRAEGFGVLACLLVGALAGVAWAALAPTPSVVRFGDVLVSRQVPELYAAQDGVFALLGLGLGLVTGVVLLVRPGRRPALWTALVVLAAAAGSVLAWRVGVLLGPPPVAEQLAAAGVPAGDGGAAPPDGDDPPLEAPLGLLAPGVLALWPATAAAVVLVSALGDMLSDRYPPERRPRRPRRPRRVSGGTGAPSPPP
jgi:hypothetical protein